MKKGCQKPTCLAILRRAHARTLYGAALGHMLTRSNLLLLEHARCVRFTAKTRLSRTAQRPRVPEKAANNRGSEARGVRARRQPGIPTLRENWQGAHTTSSGSRRQEPRRQRIINSRCFFATTTLVRSPPGRAGGGARHRAPGPQRRPPLAPLAAAPIYPVHCRLPPARAGSTVRVRPACPAQLHRPAQGPPCPTPPGCRREGASHAQGLRSYALPCTEKQGESAGHQAHGLRAVMSAQQALPSFAMHAGPALQSPPAALADPTCALAAPPLALLEPALKS